MKGLIHALLEKTDLCNSVSYFNGSLVTHNLEAIAAHEFPVKNSQVFNMICLNEFHDYAISEAESGSLLS
jgi:hypothetical protein